MIFAAWRRPWRGLAALDREGRRTLLAMGVVLALMNACFYVAIDHLPLGTVAAIEFLPVIGLAALGVRSPRNALALALAVPGVYVLTDVQLAGEPVGVAFAFANAALFALYIVLAHRVSRSSSLGRIDGLAASMLIAAVAITPIGLASAAPALLDPVALAAGIGVGIASSVIPYVCDQLAMARLTRSAYSLMVSLLPGDCDDSGHRRARPDPVGRRGRRRRPGRRRRRPSTASARPMRYTRLGSTGLKVSRICLGMMSYGDPASRAWFLDEEAAEPIVSASRRGGRHLLRHRRHVLRGRERGDHGPPAREAVPAPRRLRARDEGLLPDGARPERPRALAQAHPLRHRRLAAAARAPTTSTSTRSIAGTPRRRSRRRWRRCTTSCRAGKARYIGASSMFAWQFAKAQHTAEAHGWTRFASMQNHYNLVYREEEREMIPLCLDQGVGVLPWSPLARGLLAGGRDRRTTRAGSDRYAEQLYDEGDYDVVDAVRAVADERGLPPAQIALAWLLAQAGRDRADRRSDEARPPGGRGRRGRGDAERRGDGPAGGAVPAAPGARPLLARSFQHSRLAGIIAAAASRRARRRLEGGTNEEDRPQGHLGVLAAVTLGVFASAAGLGTAARQVAPVNTVPPAISGTPQQSQTLTTSNGTWTGTAPISFRVPVAAVQQQRQRLLRHRRCNRADVPRPRGGRQPHASAPVSPRPTPTARPLRPRRLPPSSRGAVPARRAARPGTGPVNVTSLAPPARLTVDGQSLAPSPVGRYDADAHRPLPRLRVRRPRRAGSARLRDGHAVQPVQHPARAGDGRRRLGAAVDEPAAAATRPPRASGCS